ncbi:MAG: peptidoglycan editing factor PgeF [Pseudohongiellaceae bacterium]
MNVLANGLLSPKWHVPANIVARVTTRQGGVSVGNYTSFNLGAYVGDDRNHVIENRQRLAQLIDSGIKLQWLNQVHGNRVIDAGKQSVFESADAAYCRQPGIACCITTADCLPVFIASRNGDEVGLIHAGWRGLADGVVENCLNAMKTAPDQCEVWLGPAIGPCHFEVGSEVRDRFLESADSGQCQAISRCFIAAGTAGRYMADLYELTRIRLSAMGVASVSGGGLCTYCDEKNFYSFRVQPVTGRMLSLIYLKP